MTDAIEAALLARVRPWAEKAGRIVEARVADARSHAWHALTDRVVGARDGRQTMRLASQSRSFRAAVARLEEITDRMAGPAGSASRGLIRDARAASYRDSFRLWYPAIPAEIRDERAGPTEAGESAARSLVIHGRELRNEVWLAVESARSALLATVTAAGNRKATDRQARDLLDAWERQKGDAVTARVLSLLSDSDVAIFQAVGRVMVRPEFRDESEG